MFHNKHNIFSTTSCDKIRFVFVDGFIYLVKRIKFALSSKCMQTKYFVFNCTYNKNKVAFIELYMNVYNDEIDQLKK